MRSVAIRCFALAVGLCVFPLPAFADGERPSPAMKVKVFEIRNRDTEELLRAIKPLLSGSPGATSSQVESLRTITIRDFPENLSGVEQALRLLDMPRPRVADVVIQWRVLLASNAGPGKYPPDLEPVVKQLQANLNFKGYTLVADVSQRVRMDYGTSGKGTSQVEPPASDEPSKLEYEFAVDQISISPSLPAGGPSLFQLRKLRFELEGRGVGSANIATALTVREGEKVVVGTATLRSRAMIVVVSAKSVR